MDLLQVALIFLIIVVAVSLSILGLQVFFILKDLRKSLDKIDSILSDTKQITHDIEKPIAAVANVVETVETGVQAVKAVSKVVGKATEKVVEKSSKKPSKRFFKRL